MKNKDESRKKITITLDKGVTKIPTYDFCLVRNVAGCVEMHLAEMTETDTEVNLLVESVFRIKEEAVPNFARQIMKALGDIEKEEPQAQVKG